MVPVQLLSIDAALQLVRSLGWQLGRVKSQRPTCTLPLTSSFIYESVSPGKARE